jgi:uracil-DNA glycosylase
MPNLTRIVCLGQDAWDCACVATGVRGDWVTYLDAGHPLGLLLAAYHPAARVPFANLERPWRALFPAL